MSMKRIVVGVDGSVEAMRALEWAADLAAVTGAEVTAVAVFEVQPYLGYGLAPVYIPDLGQLRTELRTDLDSWCETLRTRKVRFQAIMREGSAAEELLKEADAKPTDLIVVGSRGRGGFRELLLGSVAHHVTLHSTHPVVVIPARAARAAAESAPREAVTA